MRTRARAWRGALVALVLAACSMTTEARAQCRGRPTDAGGYQGYVYGAASASFDTTHLRVHWATSGAHVPDLATTRADEVPDTVAHVGESGEAALAKYASMGFRLPPSDAACSSNGGDAKLDVYLVSFGGADGAAVTESCSGAACATFVLVESSFLGRGYPSIAEGFQTVVAHELFHAVQNAYDAQMDRFWAEGTAQWAMKQVFPDLVDFERQLPAFFSQPGRSLDTQPSGVTAGYLYGSAVWPLFLTLRHGEDAVRAVLDAQATGLSSIPATESVLGARGSSLADAFPTFAAWNVATRALAGDGGYPDAARYPGVASEDLTDGASAITSGLSSFVYRGAFDEAASVSLDTDPERNAGVVFPVANGRADLARLQKLPANVTGDVVVVVAGITTKKTDAPFAVRIGAPLAEPVAPKPTEEPTEGDDVGDAGGCATAGSASVGARAPGPLALAGMFALVLGARRRARRGPR